MNQCKEDACFVSSSDFYAEMAAAKLPTMKNLIAKDYVLPDFLNIHRGFLRTPGATSKEENEQLIHLKNERFAIPEILFHPSDIGINQMGLTEAIAAVINRCPSGIQFLIISYFLIIIDIKRCPAINFFSVFKFNFLIF